MTKEQIAEIERQMIAEHRKDLEALARLKRFLPTTNGSTPTVLSASGEHGHNDADHATGEEEWDNAPVTSLRGKVLEVMLENPNTGWTTQKMVSHLKSINFPAEGAEDPVYSVGQALNILLSRDQIKRVRKGSGSEPNVYKAKRDAISQPTELSDDRQASLMSVT